MDQLNGAIRWLKKNGFWIGCFLMSALMIGIWFLGFSSIGKATESSVSKINQRISTTNSIQRVTADGVVGNPAHPNAKSEEGIKEEMARTVESIIEAWEKRVEDQKKILQWPSDVIQSAKFAATFSRYDPPELIPEKWLQGDGRLRPLLELYEKNIPKQMVVLTGDNLLRTRWNYDPDRLAALEKLRSGQPGSTPVKKRQSVESYEGDEGGYGAPTRPQAGGGASGATETSPGFIVDELTGETIDLNSYAVIWNDTNQLLWQTKMTEFKGRDDHRASTNTPTPLQCCMLQQDLWLLEAMFKIIREVNGDSEANDVSAIKRLDHVVFGRDVGGKLGELTPFDPSLGAAITPGLDDFPEQQDIEHDEGLPTALSDAPIVSPYHKRYVDLNFEPLDAEKVKTIIEGDVLPEEDLEMIVSKRVPVRIAVRMKETEIANFMAACANSPFAFEIQQVRWNKHIPGEEIALGGAPASLFGRPRTRRPTFGGGSGSKGGGPILTSTPVETRTNYDVNVEFYGIVKIYNPVRPKVLRDAAGIETEVDPNDAASVGSPQSGRSRL